MDVGKQDLRRLTDVQRFALGLSGRGKPGKRGKRKKRGPYAPRLPKEEIAAQYSPQDRLREQLAEILDKWDSILKADEYCIQLLTRRER